jgi:hypothetical protein
MNNKNVSGSTDTQLCALSEACPNNPHELHSCHHLYIRGESSRAIGSFGVRAGLFFGEAQSKTLFEQWFECGKILAWAGLQRDSSLKYYEGHD